MENYFISFQHRFFASVQDVPGNILLKLVDIQSNITTKEKYCNTEISVFFI